MSRRGSNTGFLGTSFLDLLCCALGGVLLLVLVLQQNHETTVQDLERDKYELAQKILLLKKGISVPLPLAIQIHWEGAGDIDLSVVRDGAERVWFQNRECDWGQLMRDETQGQTINSELFLSPQPQVGEYKVYVWYYGGGSQSQYTIQCEIALYPGDRSRSTRQQFERQLPVSPKQAWQHAATYQLTRSGNEFQITFLD